MPSAAQTRGRALVDSLLPGGMRGPDATIRARRREGADAIAVTLMPHMDSGSGGEYRRTVVLGTGSCAHDAASMGTLGHLVARWVEVERVVRTLGAASPVTGAPDGPGTPAWRFHCPSALRSLCDRAGMDGRERVALVERGGTIEADGFLLRVHEVEGRERPPWGSVGRGARTVRRITIEREGLMFSQGVTRCYLKLRAVIPQVAETAVLGLPLRNLVAVPGLEHDWVQPVRRGRTLDGGWTEFEITRAFAMLAEPPATE